MTLFLFAFRLLARLVAGLVVLALPIIVAARLYVRLIDRHPSNAAVVAFNLGVALSVGAAVVIWAVVRFRGRHGGPPTGVPASTVHGSARWASAGLPATARGLVIGREGGPTGPLLRYAGDAHLLTLAPTGAGKGIGCVIPNLLTYPGSVLVTDPKGENYAVTARRRRELGHHVVALDPFGLVGGTGAFNPLDALDPEAPDAVDDAASLADLIVVREPRESGDSVFWAEEAKALLTGLILHVASDDVPGRRNLRTLWEYLSLAPREMTQLWTAMGRSCAAGGAVARAAARVRQKGDRVRSGILAQAQSQAHFLDSRQIARALDRSTFSFDDLTASPISVYLVLPPDRIDSCRRWLRLLVGCALHAVVRARAPSGGGRERVLFLLDEFPALGTMPPLERAVALARGYGVTCWLLAQDLSQLRALYPSSWSTFVANAGVVQAFGTNDIETATYLSAMLGTTTVQSTSAGRSVGSARGLWGRADCRESWTVTERARALLSPDEVRRLDPTTALILAPGADPIRASRLDYRRDASFAGAFDENPLRLTARRRESPPSQPCTRAGSRHR
jgi:type IV secretion system protein VirD4